jgi:hypothetical protein
MRNDIFISFSALFRVGIAWMRLSQPKSRHKIDMRAKGARCNIGEMTISVCRFETPKIYPFTDKGAKPCM